ncbi:AEC family transporter [Methanoplanus sp. FWC-SCC4]|uniref:AEC family transporter n=1 Tax=Methanochimaera problematica TaxID=2609417 RepID=A0AA97I3A4_9EURY|nr:AEC family transporter [Methanoplanus sp. FWC-SCC4]WOF17145.1 AEC family transporter [Methanoplanus sp. FWC-SCC4]
MDFIVIVNSIIILFLLMAVGYICFKSGIINREGAKGLSSFLVNIALPSLIVVSMQIPLNADTYSKTMEMFGIAAVFYILSFVFAVIIPRYLTESDLEKGVYGFMLLFSNLGFMGIPVSAAIFGQEAVFYTSLFMLPFGILVFSVGVLMLRPDMGRYLDKKLFLNSGIIASAAGLIFFFTGFQIPSPALDVLTILGSLTTPLAMIVVGALLATMPFSGMIKDKKIYAMSFFRLIAIPVVLFIILKPFVDDPMLLGIPVILAAMPAAANAVLMAEEYGVDSNSASKGVFISTMLCVVTIPAIAVLLL